MFSGRTRSEISVKMLIACIYIFAMPSPALLQDVLILSRMTYLSLSGLARECCSFILRKLKDDFTETFFVVKVMLLALI